MDVILNKNHEKNWEYLLLIGHTYHLKFKNYENLKSVVETINLIKANFHRRFQICAQNFSKSCNLSRKR